MRKADNDAAAGKGGNEPAQPAKAKPLLKQVGGSKSDDWNNTLANQAMQAVWLTHSSPEERDRQMSATLAALAGIAPKDELEGMIAAQLIACHNAAMECYRRAMIGEQSFEGRRENLSQANKLSRTHATLLEALNRHRGKGQQIVRVERVTVHEGGQAIVGSVNAPTPGGGAATKTGEQPHALAYAPGVEMPRQIEAERATVPSAGGAGHSVCRMHGAAGGAPRGNKNALKHGNFTAETIAFRKKIAALARMARETIAASNRQSLPRNRGLLE